ncbi:Ammonium transporter Rh type C-like 2 [Hypsibius exemplaris]|uniref:Ammonium transporter Rh type C-like 2 n=1 Tax=Hypsibius exemplaris TaxID=2072580 RepID=A0A1W0WPX1_HYPEX|nr:Ammonium transporter Rh type C-like 2 [Hypsibius exemplaris]
MSETSPVSSHGGGASSTYHRTNLQDHALPLVYAKDRSAIAMLEAVWSRKKIGLIIGISQLAFIIIFGFLVDYGWDGSPASKRTSSASHSEVSKVVVVLPGKNASSMALQTVDHPVPVTTSKFPVETYYAMFQDVHVMVFVGFGFLMTFLRKYGYSSVGFNFLLAAYVLQWSTLMRGFLRLSENDYRIKLDIVSLINSDFTAATILISFGVVLGKLSMSQYLIMVLFETVFVTINEWICYEMFFIKDVGGTVAIHLFGAFFGLALARTIHQKKWSHDDFNKLKFGSHYNDLLSLIGTLFLWMFWPSFNAALATDDGRYRAVFNTYFAITASCLSAFMTSSFLSHGKFSLDIIQNSTLAGGVVVGAVCDMYLYPWGALICGAGAGVISALGYFYLGPILDRKLGFHDTCGVNNLHAMPAFLGTLISAIVAGCATKEVYGSGYYTQFPKHAPLANTKEFLDLKALYPDLQPGLGWTPAIQAGYQMAAMGVTLALAIGGAVLTGMVLRLPIWDAVNEYNVFEDDTHWELPTKMKRDDEAQLRERIGRVSKDGDYNSDQPVVVLHTLSEKKAATGNGYYSDHKAPV